MKGKSKHSVAVPSRFPFGPNTNTSAWSCGRCYLHHQFIVAASGIRCLCVCVSETLEMEDDGSNSIRRMSSRTRKVASKMAAALASSDNRAHVCIVCSYLCIYHSLNFSTTLNSLFISSVHILLRINLGGSCSIGCFGEWQCGIWSCRSQ